MDVQLGVDSDNKIVKASCFGLLDQENRKKILTSVSIGLKENGYSKALIDVAAVTISPAEPLSNALNLVVFMHSIGIGHNAKIAFVYSDSETHRKFFRKVAQTAGISIEYFRNDNHAIEWLDQHTD